MQVQELLQRRLILGVFPANAAIATQKRRISGLCSTKVVLSEADREVVSRNATQSVKYGAWCSKKLEKSVSGFRHGGGCATELLQIPGFR